MKVLTKDKLNPAALNRAYAGAAKLDELRPGWDQEVNLTTLQLSSPRHCVLGQVFDIDAREDPKRSFVDGFDYAFERLFGGNEDNETFNLGFDHTAKEDQGLAEDGAYVTYRDLDDAWTWLITARREQRAVFETYAENLAFSEGYEDGYFDGQRSMLDAPKIETVSDIAVRLTISA